MSPEDLRAEAAWLLKLSGWHCAWPIETTRDLRDYAEIVADDEDLTGVEVRSVNELVARLNDALATPEQRARKAKREAKQLLQRPEGTDDLTWAVSRAMSCVTGPRTEAWHAAGAFARREHGERKRIIAAYRRLKNRDPRVRAGIIADTLGLTAIYVRRVLKSAGER